MGLPQLLASHDVEKRQGKENSGEQQHRHILHRISQFQGHGYTVLTGKSQPVFTPDYCFPVRAMRRDPTSSCLFEYAKCSVRET
jgi:hypothetical protein